MKKVAVGLSGGVDSAVSAALLVEQGYEVMGVFLECWRALGCRVDEDRRDAMDVARKLGIQFRVLDFKKEYKEKVVDYFFAEYEAGRTPNPDTMCNREIKFGMFYEWAMSSGFDYVATGHYARIRRIREVTNKKKQDTNKIQIPNHKYQLLKGVDEKKDQSYFLYQLREEQLEHILFPIGEMTKDEVRKKANDLGLSVAKKPDSQGICFIGEVSVVDFLKELGMKEKQGSVFLQIRNPKSKILNKIKIQNTNDTNDSNLEFSAYDLENNFLEIGQHRGAWFYTVGQRHGFTIQDLRFKNDDQEKEFRSRFELSSMPPLYVIEKDVTKNVLVVGTREMLLRKEFEVGEIHWVNEDLRFKIQDLGKIHVRIRHGGQLIPAEFKNQTLKINMTGQTVKIMLEKEVFGVASGQACVIYGGDAVLGGGVIVG